MTDPNQPDAPATGADDTTTTAQADGAATGQPQGDTLEQRIQSDPAFALEQYKKVKGESTKLYQKTKSYEPITRIADQLGGSEVAAQLLNEFAAIAQSAEVARIREHYRTHGTLPTTSSARTDDTTDDDVYKDPQTIEIEKLRSELAEVRNSVSQTQGIVGKQNVTGMLERLKQEYPDGFDEFILPVMQTTFDDWNKTPGGRNLLANVNYDQMKVVAAKAIAENLDTISERRHLRILEGKKKAATGAPSQIMSTGREPSAEKGAKNALEALTMFKREFGERFH